MEYDDEKREKLEKLERKLYARGGEDVIDKGRSELKKDRIEDWRNNPEPEGLDLEKLKKSNFDALASKVSDMAKIKHNFVKKIFIISILFFILSAGVATFVFLGGTNLVSSKNVDIQVVGPVSIPGGQEVSFDINVINNNNIDLDSASLLVEYPKGTRSGADLSKDLTQERFALEAIKSNKSFNQNIKAVFFGEKENVMQIKISLEYRVANSSALFYKEKIYEVSVSSAPVIITPTYPKEVNSNQEISFNIEVVSNSKDKINDFLVKVEYPFGFVFKDSSLKPSYGNNVWYFSDLNAGEKENISIRGSIIGQDNEERVFKISTGTANENDERSIAVPFSELTESILVKKPFIGIEAFIEGENRDIAVAGGREVETKLAIQNNLPAELFNTSVQVAFKGGAFDGQSVVVRNDGFFQSLNNTILWDKRAVALFSNMAPGSVEELSFRLTPLLYLNILKGARPEIEMTITVRGERILDSGSIEPVIAIATRKIILATDLSLSSKGVRSLGSIENQGPIPPKVNMPTTYTIIWAIKNSINQVSGLEVRATLPSYVKWTNLYSPISEAISYNQVTNEVVWNAGSMLGNMGGSFSEKQVYFQLEFLPSSSQIGQSPIILGRASLSGLDKITGLKINSQVGAVTTNFAGDPSFKSGDERVVE